jgi:CRP-like cAMP-binding protein
LDAGLGVSRESRLAQQALASRAFMPAKHRAFLGIVDEAGGIIRSFIAKTDSVRLRRGYNECLRGLWKFRTVHRVRGAHYLEAGRCGSSGRASTGIGIVYRPPEGSKGCPYHGGGRETPAGAADPIADFKLRMNERIAELDAARLPGDERSDEPTVENALRFLTPEERTSLIEGAARRTFQKGEVIVQQGDVGQALYVIEEGFVRIEKKSADGAVVLARLWPGEVFAEISFLCDIEATASAIADEDVKVQILDRDYIYELIASSSAAFGMRFYESLAVQLASRLRATSALLAEFESRDRSGTAARVAR